MGPLKLSYPCNQCKFEATSARQLSRHKAVTHVKNPLTCILCPFVTAYQTNLLRHKREVHGILGSKGNKSCKFCGFEAEDNNTLILHQQQSHQDILKLARERFAREKKSARGSNSFSQSAQLAENLALNGLTVDEVENVKHEEANDDDDKDFWKEGFLDNPPNLLLNYNSSTPLISIDSNSNNHINSYSLLNNNRDNSLSPLSFENALSEYSTSRPATPLNTATKMISQPSSPSNSNTSLAPTKIRRQYSCSDCGFRTVNPREFLHHRRDVHNQKVKIVECPYCVYACQYFQKLQRHILLVHKLETSMTPPAELLAIKQEAIDDDDSSPFQPSPKSASDTLSNNNLSNTINDSTFQDSNLAKSNSVLDKEESEKSQESKLEEVKDENLAATDDGQFDQAKKRDFCCSLCGYSTHVQYLFKKHLKYHNAPKIKCDLCDFESPYSWNVERHARSHRLNGAYKCIRCNFSSEKPQGITIHVNQHHRDKVIPEVVVKSDNLDNLSFIDGINSSVDESLENDVEVEEVNAKSLDEDENEDLEIDLSETNGLEERENAPSYLKVDSDVGEVSEGIKQSIKNGSKIVTYVRKADGRIIARPSVFKKCKYCNYQADSLSKLQKHESTSHPEKRFQCPLCEIRFENLVWLQRHLMHMHKEDTQADNIVNILKMLRPKKKSGNTSAKSSLKLGDVENESSNVPLNRKTKPSKDQSATTCKICGYQTRWISELQKHMRVHTKEKPFICPYCSFRSKWKGDLNRHIQKYHSLQPMPDLDKMEKEALRIFSSQPECDLTKSYDKDVSKEATEVEKGELNQDEDMEECELKIDLGDAQVEDNESNLLKNVNQECKVDGDDNETGSAKKSGKIKLYECCYCDFTCTTASRFHVHFVQHLNLKPFMCSVCGHRSNWEWDVTKHIKIKAQKDSNHLEAKLVLIHDSNKRDYRKYNKYIIWVNQEDVDTNGMLINKLNSKAKKMKLENEDTNLDGKFNYHQDDNQETMRNCSNPESMVITPDFSFAIPCYKSEKRNPLANENCESYKSESLRPNVPYFSAANQTKASKYSKLFYCAYCDYSNVDRKLLVSHMSTHTGLKPYKCNLCSFSSNWKEVVVRHVSSRHNGSSKDVIQRLKYIVNKYICRIVDESGEIDPGPEITRSEAIMRPLASINNSNSNEMTELDEQENNHYIPTVNNQMYKKCKDSKLTPSSSAKKPVLACPSSTSTIVSSKFSGFRGAYQCSLCPFRAEKSFHINFHAKRHQPVKGADFKCPHCPYWVNAKKSLTKHIYLHDYESEMEFQNSRFGGLNQDSRLEIDSQSDYEGDDDQSERENGVVGV